MNENKPKLAPVGDLQAQAQQQVIKRNMEQMGKDPTKLMVVTKEVMDQLMQVVIKLPYDQVGGIIPALEANSLRLDLYNEMSKE